ncbi:enoyl-CoA hydratase-related protein [Psychrobacillus sp. NEAU-3TGS]|uniref:enoyl-CoA hydratase-related protein n=1 Tax=Psychrobacillus sp. NEAU-3TGS TaxID=2995412 RepID=UPI0032B4A457
MIYKLQRGMDMAYTIEKRDEIIVFEINRPTIHNAINGEVVEGFKQLVQRVKTDSSIKFAVITGVGEKRFVQVGISLYSIC